jgi:hypothetical protein
VLTLPLNGVYFDQILAGTKLEEYRLTTGFWSRRIMCRQYDQIVLTRGYPKGGGVEGETRLTLPWRGYTVKTITHRRVLRQAGQPEGAGRRCNPSVGEEEMRNGKTFLKTSSRLGGKAGVGMNDFLTITCHPRSNRGKPPIAPTGHSGEFNDWPLR